MHWNARVQQHFVVLFALAICSPAFAQVAIESVTIKLNAERGAHQISGKLYRISNKEPGREWAANVALTGRLSRTTRCNPQDIFEAEVDHAVVFPDNPVRVQCDRTLSFSFTRPSFARRAMDASFLDVAAEKIDIDNLSKLSEAADTTGQPDVSMAANDEVVKSTALWLGDVRLDKYVQRNADRNYQLELSQDGVDALKRRQLEANLAPTGSVDAATRTVISRQRFKPSDNLRTSYCILKASAGVVCSPYKSEPPPGALNVHIQFKY